MTLEEAKQLIETNRTEEAISALDSMIATDPNNDALYFLRGNAWRKHNHWKNALSDYCKATELNPDSPAAKAYHAAIEILNFYNKDLYNP